jgi:hypothetical protein
MSLTIKDHLRNLRYVQGGAATTIDDLISHNSGHKLRYHLDFSLLCPALFKMPSPGSGNFLDFLKNPVNRIISGSRSENSLYQLSITGATLIEFYDQLNHQIEWLEQKAPEQIKNYREKYLKSPTDNDLVTAQRVRRDLQLFTKDGYHEQIVKPVNKLIDWLDEGSIVGIGDLVSSEVEGHLKAKKGLFRTLLERQKSRRLSQERTRSIEDSIFHYSIDAVNICITRAIAEVEESPVFFVTPTLSNIKGCVVDEENLARRDRVPLFLLNLQHLLKNKDIEDQVEYLQDAFRDAEQILAKLQKYSSMDEVPTLVDVHLEKFYQMYMSPLFIATEEEDARISHNWEEIGETLSSNSKMKEVLESAAQDLKDGAQILNLEASRFNTSYLDEFDFNEDPVLRKLKKTLGID